MISSLFKNLAIYFNLTNSTRTYNQPNPHESKPARNNPTTYLHRLQYNDRRRQRTLPYVNFIPNNNNCAVSVDDNNFLYQQQLPVLTHNTPYSSNLSTITCEHVSKQFRNKRNPSQSSRIRRLESGVKRFNSKIDMLKEKQSFNETINVTYNTEKLKEQIILWILKEKNFLGTVTDQAIIDKIADKISSSFADDAKSAILFLCYTCFLTKTFVGFREMHFGNPVNILIIQHPLSTFDLAALEVAIDKWKTFKLDYTSMREGYEKIQMVIQELDPSWLFFCNQKIYSSFKITTIFCLGHFFEKESDLK